MERGSDRPPGRYGPGARFGGARSRRGGVPTALPDPSDSPRERGAAQLALRLGLEGGTGERPAVLEPLPDATAPDHLGLPAGRLSITVRQTGLR